MKVIVRALCVVSVVLTLSACGVKPKELSPPAGSTQAYPNTYPSPQTVE